MSVSKAAQDFVRSRAIKYADTRAKEVAALQAADMVAAAPSLYTAEDVVDAFKVIGAWRKRLEHEAKVLMTMAHVMGGMSDVEMVESFTINALSEEDGERFRQLLVEGGG